MLRTPTALRSSRRRLPSRKRPTLPPIACRFCEVCCRRSTTRERAAAGLGGADAPMGASHHPRGSARRDGSTRELASSLLKRATDAATRADVRAAEGVLDAAARRDAELGRRRPDEINALLEQVQGPAGCGAQAPARARSVARADWQLIARTRRWWRRSSTGCCARSDSLDDIKRLAGSEAAVLVGLGERLGTNMKTLSVIPVPDELKPAHALLMSAVNLAETAVKNEKAGDRLGRSCSSRGMRLRRRRDR